MSKIGICGLDCGACFRYKATQSGKVEELEKVKQFYVRIGLLQESFSALELACSGCGPTNRCAYPDVRECAISRNHETCGNCTDYPCEKIAVAFNAKATWVDDVASKCTAEEHSTLKSAFLSRKRNLDKIFESKRRAI